MVFDVHLRREGLPDVGHVAQNGAQSALLTHLQLLADKRIGRGLGRRPRHFGPQLHTQPPSDTHPVGIAHLFFIISSFDGVVHARRNTQSRRMAVVAGIVPATA